MWLVGIRPEAKVGRFVFRMQKQGPGPPEPRLWFGRPSPCGLFHLNGDNVISPGYKDVSEL
jgi:hypothetical protein